MSSDELVEDVEFTCPVCGSHHFGSGMPGITPGDSLDAAPPFTEQEYIEKMEGECHGRLDDGRCCVFTWRRKDDSKYFKGRGTFHPRAIIGKAP